MSGNAVDLLGLGDNWLSFLQNMSDAVVFGGVPSVSLPPYPWQSTPNQA
jgi:hypothetical protein